MNALVAPFRALRPRPEHAQDVVAPPYDVVDTEEARALADGRPMSFLHISRPEIDLPEGTDPHADAVYAQGAANLAALVERGVLVREDSPAYYVYRMTLGGHVQTGVACAASVDAYERNLVRRHELTRPDKEDDRVRNIESLNAQTGPVLCAYRADAALREALAMAAGSAPLLDVEGPGGSRHQLWPITGDDAAAIGRALNGLGLMYIADGHHRSAAAARVARARRGAAAGAEASFERFLAVAFPHDEMRIFDYNRVIADLHGLTAAQLLERVAEVVTVAPAESRVSPGAPGTFGMYLDGRWYRLTVAPQRIPADPVASLDVSLLQDLITGPLLGIDDPRTNPRIGFVGGVRGLEELERLVDGGRAAVAFAMHPTRMEQLMAVADADRLMPPKSTWFEPKLVDGLLSHVLD